MNIAVRHCVVFFCLLLTFLFAALPQTYAGYVIRKAPTALADSGQSMAVSHEGRSHNRANVRSLIRQLKKAVALQQDESAGANDKARVLGMLSLYMGVGSLAAMLLFAFLISSTGGVALFALWPMLAIGSLVCSFPARKHKVSRDMGTAGLIISIVSLGLFVLTVALVIAIASVFI